MRAMYIRCSWFNLQQSTTANGAHTAWWRQSYTVKINGQNHSEVETP